MRNEFNFWNVYGIMNASGLLQSKTLKETRSIHDSMNIPKIFLECLWNHECFGSLAK